METAVSAAILLICLIIVPLFCGLVFDGRGRGAARILTGWAVGMLMMMAAYEIAAVPLILMHRKLTDSIFAWTAVLAVMLICAVLRRISSPGGQKPGLSGPDGKRPGLSGPDGRKTGFSTEAGTGGAAIAESEKWTAFCLILAVSALILIGMQCAFYVFGMHIDDDDARYIANALAASETNTMYRYHPNMGSKMSYFMGEIGKEVTSPLMMYYAALSRISGIHAAIMIHTVLPPVLLVLSYAVIWLLSASLWPESREKRLIFTVVCALLRMMGNTSIYTGSTFTLMRIWQGKALAPALFVPLFTALFVQRFMRGEMRGWYRLLFIGNAAACLSSGMGILIAAAYTGICAVVFAFREKSVGPGIKCALCAIPNCAYMVIYLLVWKVVLR